MTRFIDTAYAILGDDHMRAFWERRTRRIEDARRNGKTGRAIHGYTHRQQRPGAKAKAKAKAPPPKADPPQSPRPWQDPDGWTHRHHHQEFEKHDGKPRDYSMVKWHGCMFCNHQCEKHGKNCVLVPYGYQCPTTLRTGQHETALGDGHECEQCVRELGDDSMIKIGHPFYRWNQFPNGEPYPRNYKGPRAPSQEVYEYDVGEGGPSNGASSSNRASSANAQGRTRTRSPKPAKAKAEPRAKTPPHKAPPPTTLRPGSCKNKICNGKTI